MRGATYAICVSLGLIAILAVTLAAFGAPVVSSLQLMAEGAFSDKFAISRTLVKATPLMMTGVAMVVAWRSGMYNIGGEGQFVVGGLAAAWIAKAFGATPTGPGAETVVLLATSTLGGAMWAGFAGWLRTKRGVEIVISTILLNFVALQFLSYAVSGPLQEHKKQLPLTEKLPDSAMLLKFDRQADLHVGIFLALVAAVVVHVWLNRTRDGFRARLVGASPRVARANLIDSDAVKLRAIVVSGGLCGLAGGIEYTGVAGQLGTSFSQQWGFIAIPVALLAGLHPLWVIVSALYFGALFAGSENLARFSHAGTTMIFVIQGVAVLGIVALQRFSQTGSAATEAP